jgi:hypothetical protein
MNHGVLRQSYYSNLVSVLVVCVAFQLRTVRRLTLVQESQSKWPPRPIKTSAVLVWSSRHASTRFCSLGRFLAGVRWFVTDLRCMIFGLTNTCRLSAINGTSRRATKHDILFATNVFWLINTPLWLAPVGSGRRLSRCLRSDGDCR